MSIMIYANTKTQMEYRICKLLNIKPDGKAMGGTPYWYCNTKHHVNRVLCGIKKLTDEEAMDALVDNFYSLPTKYRTKKQLKQILKKKGANRE